MREAGVSYQDLQDWKQQTTAFSSMTATHAAAASRCRTRRRAGTLSRARRSPGTCSPCSACRPLLGRHFNPEDDRAGAEPVVILSDDVWAAATTAIAASSAAASRVNGRPHTVVGVMPPKFSFPENQKVWIPLAPIAEKDPRTSRYLFTFGRMKPGVDLARARADWRRWRRPLAAQYPDDQRGLERHRAAADRRIHSGRRAAGVVDDDGRGDAGVADRVRECRQPDAGARLGTAARILGEGRARRRPRAHGQAAADRMRAARSRLGAARHRDRVPRRAGCSTARCRRATCPTTSTGRSAGASSPTRSRSPR